MPDQSSATAAKRKASFEPVRAARILELSRQWNVPTKNIYSTSNWGYDETMDVPRMTTYYAFDPAGTVNRQKIDYGPVIGYAAGTYSPKPINSSAQTLSAATATSGTRPAIIDQAAGTTPTLIPKTMKKGGKLKKATDGDVLPRRSVADYFSDPANRNLIPNDASLNGPQPGSEQYFIDPDTGDVSADGPKPSPIQGGFNLSLNAGALITGVNAGINQMYDHQRGLEEFNRLKRKQLQGPGYNPNQYGTGSQAIFKNGGSITPISANIKSAPIVEFNGPSHEQGGIPISFHGKQVEVEGNETGYVDKAGDLNVFGNMDIPGTRIKYKTAGKQIAAAEQKSAKKMNKGLALINDADPHSKFDSLKINTGNLLTKAAGSEQQALTMLKERLSALQEAHLSSVGSTGGGDSNVPIARNGFAEDQDDQRQQLKPSMAQRHNNPGNIKYAAWEKKYGAVKGERSSDGDNFARFPNMQSGLSAMKALLRSKSYSGSNVADALKKWTGGEGYKIDLGDLADKKVTDLNDAQMKQLMNTITNGEDSRLYDLDFLYSAKPQDPKIDTSIHPPAMGVRNPYAPPGDLPPVPGTYTNPPYQGPGVPNLPTKPLAPPDLPDIKVPTGGPKKPVKDNLAFSQIAPELLALMDRPDFVPGQRYEPNLYQPYQVSFQDRLNENNAAFSKVAALTGHNPAALSVIAGQKYLADSNVLADEFRTNQGITNDVTNKNIALLNDAQVKNLQLADTQFLRQSQAVANTRQNIYNAVESLSNKIGQNRLETRSYNAASSLFPRYDFDNNGSLQYNPNPDMVFSPVSADGSPDGYYQRYRTEYGPSDNVRKTTVNTPSDAEKAKLDAQLKSKQQPTKRSLLDYLPTNRRSR